MKFIISIYILMARCCIISCKQIPGVNYQWKHEVPFMTTQLMSLLKDKIQWFQHPALSILELRAKISMEVLTHPFHFLKLFQLNATRVHLTVFGRGLHEQKVKKILNLISLTVWQVFLSDSFVPTSPQSHTLVLIYIMVHQQGW